MESDVLILQKFFALFPSFFAPAHAFGHVIENTGRGTTHTGSGGQTIVRGLRRSSAGRVVRPAGTAKISKSCRLARAGETKALLKRVSEQIVSVFSKRRTNYIGMRTKQTQVTR